ncbi:MAG: TrkA family protein [Hyphomicrobiales bacterium]|nr:TrkA family protein [Hyphomicrobiales bacterium]
MTLPQAFAFAVVLGMMALFAWGRLRYDIVAMLALLAAMVSGIVPVKDAFKGFGDDIVIIVASAMIVGSAVSKSGVIEMLVRRISPFLTTSTRQVAGLAGGVALLSAVVKNIGALSMMMPVASQIARKHDTPLSRLLMPMSFASLLGGVVTLVGTSPNIIVSKLRADMTGTPFGMFDFTPVGLPVMLAGLVVLVLTHRLLPVRKRNDASMDAAFGGLGYTAEIHVPEDSAFAGQDVAALEKEGDGDVTISTLIRGTHKRFSNPATQIVRPGDVLLIEGDPAAIEAFCTRTALKHARHERAPAGGEGEDHVGEVESVVMPGSVMIDWSTEQLRLYQRFGINVMAVSRSGRKRAQRLKDFRFQQGDLVVFQGDRSRMAETLAELGCLPLAARDVGIGRSRATPLPVIILVAAMGLMAGGFVSVPTAFFGAAVLTILTRGIAAREIYDAIDWPVLITLGALIPVSDAMSTTGATDVIASWLAMAGKGLPAYGLLAVVMVAAMAVTPFLNNAATVLVMGPIAVGFAKTLGYGADPFLMAVALGAACDFLTPIGHQCNMLVMSPGGYKFGDYARLGAPLSATVLIVGVPLIAYVWPLTGH